MVRFARTKRTKSGGAFSLDGDAALDLEFGLVLASVFSPNPLLFRAVGCAFGTILDGNECVKGQKAVAFLRPSGLPDAVLSKVWREGTNGTGEMRDRDGLKRVLSLAKDALEEEEMKKIEDWRRAHRRRRLRWYREDRHRF